MRHGNSIILCRILPLFHWAFECKKIISVLNLFTMPMCCAGSTDDFMFVYVTSLKSQNWSDSHAAASRLPSTPEQYMLRVGRSAFTAQLKPKGHYRVIGQYIVWSLQQVIQSHSLWIKCCFTPTTVKWLVTIHVWTFGLTFLLHCLFILETEET